MTDKALLVAGPDWEAMKHEHRGQVLADYIAGFRRRSLMEFWIIGRGLEAHRQGLNHGDWGAYLEEIDMRPSTAADLRRLARSYQISEIRRFATKDEALKALKAAPVDEKKPTPTPAPPRAPAPRPNHPHVGQPGIVDGGTRTAAPSRIVDGGTTVAVPSAPVEAETDEAVIEAVAAEATPSPEELRDERLERLAIVTEHVEGDVVDDWAAKLDAADERHRDDVTALDVERRIRQGAERRYRDVIDALLAVPRGEGDRGIDDVLAARGVARKQAA